jgi:hypothetical protein
MWQHRRPRGHRRLEPGRAVPYGYPLFHTHRPSTAIQWLTCASCKSAPGRRDGSKLARLPQDRLRARGTNGQGTRQDPPHQGHPQAGPRRSVRWQVPAYAGLPGAGHWRHGHRNGLPAESSKPGAGTGRAGLALAPPPAGNCAVSGRQGGLAWSVCTRDQRWPAGWQRSCDRGHGAHRASRRSTARIRHQCR